MRKQGRIPSAWGEAPTRFYRFLRRISSERSGLRDHTRFDLCVIGCADGKFVLPAARQGMRVLAIEIDPISLYGGEKPWVDGSVYIPGLVKRLDAEGLSDYVEVRCSDYMSLEPVECRAVWTSGAIQYSLNSRYTANELMMGVANHTAVGGYLYVDYMLPFEEKYVGRKNCPSREWWDAWAEGLEGWEKIYNRVLPPVLDRAHVEYPVDHYHQWGHILMRRDE